MSNAEIFIDKYKQLEEAVRVTYNLRDNDSISYYLTNQKEYQKFKEDIKYCQEVRNLLSHKKKINDRYAVEPDEEMIKFIDRLIEKIKNREKCSDIQINIKKVYWQPINGSVKKTMQVMKEKCYTYIPILQNGVVIGVFDENSVFNYIAAEECVEISDSLTFNDIKEYISLYGREMEDFIFFKERGYVEELESAIEKAFKKGRRTEIAFITINGRPDEKLQGIITPLDILALT